MALPRWCAGLAIAGLALGVSCAPSTAIRGVPLPASVKVRLRFARFPGTPFRYMVRTQEEFGPNQGLHIKTDRVLFVRETSDDSLEAHVIQVRVDSTQAGNGGKVDRGPYLGFAGWYNDLRRRLDTLAADRSIERLREYTFRTTVPLPEQAVGVGDSWDFTANERESFFHSADLPLTATARATITALTAMGIDTVAAIKIAYSLKGKLPNPNGDPVYITGTLDGDELFSVATGMSIQLRAKAQAFWTTSMNTLGGLQHFTMVIKASVLRTLER
jgi:hypothetical protein